MSEPVEGEILDDEEAPLSTALAIDQITRAEIDMQIATAKRFPRDLAQVKRSMVEMATMDEETAESCFYSLKRRDADGTNKIIQGPSVRLAEIALSCFGNIRAGTRSLGETEDGRFVRELGVCHDVQNNVMVAREVKRRITRRDGHRYGDDMIGTTMAAAGSIALRNAVLTVVPRALVKPAYEKAREVATGRAKSLTVRRAEVMGRLGKLSPLITLERVLFAVGKRSLEGVGWDDVEYLIGLGTAIKDGLQTVEEAFPPAPEVEGASRSDALLERLKNGGAPAAPAAPVQIAEDLKPPVEGLAGLSGDELSSLIRDELKRLKTKAEQEDACERHFFTKDRLAVFKLPAEKKAAGLTTLRAELDGLAEMRAEREPEQTPAEE